MKFKVINERTKEIVGSGLAICAAREVAKKYNNIEKVDYFYIKEQNKNNIHKTLHIQHLIEKCPNDANLGAEIRKYYNKLNTNSIG